MNTEFYKRPTFKNMYTNVKIQRGIRDKIPKLNKKKNVNQKHARPNQISKSKMAMFMVKLVVQIGNYGDVFVNWAHVLYIQ